MTVDYSLLVTMLCGLLRPCYMVRKLDVTHLTINRWMNGEFTPRKQSREILLLLGEQHLSKEKLSQCGVVVFND